MFNFVLVPGPQLQNPIENVFFVTRFAQNFCANFFLCYILRKILDKILFIANIWYKNMIQNEHLGFGYTKLRYKMRDFAIILGKLRYKM